VNPVRISIFVPTYNAGAHLAATLARIPAPVWENILTCWIINDGSTDDTRRIADELAAGNARVRTVHFERNRGYGAVVKEGLSRCKAEDASVTACLHGDGQYPSEEIGAFVDMMTEENVDLLQGSRHAGGTALAGGMPLYKFVAGKCLSWIENRALGLHLTDYHSGFLFYSRRALNHLPVSALSSSFDIDVELIACARALGLRIAERPIPTRYAGEVSHLHPIPYGLRVLRMTARFATGYYHRLCRQQSCASAPDALRP